MTQTDALDILKTGKNVFLTGEPGSGKTYTINRYVEYLRVCGIDPAITASTGIAATHIDGMTIHSWSGIGIHKWLSTNELRELASQKRLIDRILASRVLIIDEISMLDGRTLDLVDLVCRTIRKSDKAFGGAQVVFVGDFFQLPPIARDDEPDPQFSFASSAWKRAEPLVCYLSECHRQQDERFLEILRALRSARIEDHHKETLLDRHVSHTSEPIDSHIPKLFPHNFNVDAINDNELRKLPGSSQLFTMTHHGRKNLVDQLKRGCLSPEKLALKKGANVMFTKNSFAEGFVNGTTGTVISFDNETSAPIVKTKQGRKITVEPMQWTIRGDGKVLASISQLPLRLAWAMTVHKSQGISLDEAYMDLSRAFVPGQGYVALSRVRTLNGLHLGGINDRALEVDYTVLEQDRAFRECSENIRGLFACLAKADLQEQQKQFIKSCGGTVNVEIRSNKREPITKRKERRYEKTLELVLSGMTIEEVAQKRSRTIGTILTHLEELRSIDKLPLHEFEHIRGNRGSEIDRILVVFQAQKDEHLKPIFDHFDGKYSYETIRIARLFL